jgi:hypothetical protein
MWYLPVGEVWNIVSSGAPATVTSSISSWDDITLDFIEGLPTSQGKDTILVVVDCLSKSAHFLPLTHLIAKVMAKQFVEGVIKLHGLPKSIISDRDPIFISKFWQEFCHMFDTKLKFNSAYHP